MVIIKGEEVVNLASEMNLSQYEKISVCLEKKIAKKGEKLTANLYETDTDKWIDILTAAGLSEKALKEISLDEFIEAVKSWCASEGGEYEFLQEIEIAGRKYRAFEGDHYTTPIADGRLIEKYARANPNKYVAEMMAVIYKDVNLTDAEHYANGHIKHKANIFRKEMRGSVAVPYVAMFANSLLKVGLKQLADEQKEQNSKEEKENANA